MGSCVVPPCRNRGLGKREGHILPQRKKPKRGCRKLGKLSKNFSFVKNFLSKNAKLGAKNLSFWKNLGAKSKFWAPVISPVENWQLSIRMLSELSLKCLLENFNFLLRLVFSISTNDATVSGRSPFSFPFFSISSPIRYRHSRFPPLFVLVSFSCS